MSKRQRYKHYDNLPIEEAIKALQSTIDSLYGQNQHDSFIRDLQEQLNGYKQKLKEKNVK